MTANWTPGTWWTAPPNERFRAFYMCMRVCYKMPAKEALAYARANYPAVKNVIADTRAAISRRKQKELVQ